MSFSKLSAIHKLNSLPVFSLFKAVAVGDAEMLVKHFHALDPVDPINGGILIVDIVETFLKLRIIDHGDQVKIEFRKSYRQGLDLS